MKAKKNTQNHSTEPATIAHLEMLFIEAKDPAIAQGQSAYMRDQFSFYGIKKPVRAQLEKEWFKKFSPTNEDELIALVTALWQKPQREFQYAALELAQKHHKLWSPAIFELFEQLIRTKSWWDSVDATASNLVGKLLLKYPHLQGSMDSWIKDDNFWIRRTALIHQLRYKSKTDHEKLFFYCTLTMHEQEFFIRKAIGWALREYSKTNPRDVQAFINAHKARLSPLSIKEASKYI